jgi:hypothetical protein
MIAKSVIVEDITHLKSKIESLSGEFTPNVGIFLTLFRTLVVNYKVVYLDLTLNF